ncbi:MetQ/NlpA family ABC transporter substrate-binding protein [Peribacillus huizhouensis]|uniref:Lipoprotein n=1 Tax=Peribacillus huizhouensis TaxID=1501239 RepID=A0ABR6CPC3_9BACI|nr:MetQ/NlpA family ABC transporter substrate-binding protein [Peribacillus huizhouensis]MBA9026887.1 D-methionine transport system substrate-binding protein [Peribacillus huizhouensis]
MKKKKWFQTLAIASTLLLGLTACGTSADKKESDNGSADEKGLTKLVIGASNVPHAEILEKAKPALKEKGVDLEIKVFSDFILPNKALAAKEIDANYFQHLPYLEEEIADKGYDFVNAGAVHIEPIGIYSKKYKSLDEIPKGGKIIMRDAVSDEGRILSIFQEHGLIKLKEGINKTKATINDIVENPKKLVFQPNIEAALLPQVFNNGEGDAVVINANYALDAGLDPINDPIAVESAKDNPYVNIIAVRAGDEKREDIKALVEVLHSKEIQDFIMEKYKGAVLPAE